VEKSRRRINCRSFLYVGKRAQGKKEGVEGETAKREKKKQYTTKT